MYKNILLCILWIQSCQCSVSMNSVSNGSLNRNREIFYSEYSPYNGSLYISHELLNETSLQIHFNQLLSKYPEFKMYSIKGNHLSETNENYTLIAKKEDFDNSTSNLNQDTAKYLKAIKGLEETHNNTIKELETLQFSLNETTANLIQVRSDLAACITISAGFKQDADLWASRYAELKLSLPNYVTEQKFNRNISSFIALLQWNYTSCIQELNRCKNHNVIPQFNFE